MGGRFKIWGKRGFLLQNSTGLIDTAYFNACTPRKHITEHCKMQKDCLLRCLVEMLINALLSFFQANPKFIP